MRPWRTRKSSFATKGANKSDLEQRLSGKRTPLLAIFDDGMRKDPRAHRHRRRHQRRDASGMTPIMLAA
jgi:hypothetical protein